MNKLPLCKTVPVPKPRRERLARWLNEWNLDRLLRENGGTETDVRVAFAEMHPDLRLSAAPVAREREVRPGQIRLVSPALRAGFPRPLFIAILSGCGERMYVVAPYGRFSEPALPGELLTRRRAACLRVLCLWNAAAVGVNAVGESWLVDTLSEKEMDEARAVYRFVTQQTPLPPTLLRRTGPPLLHPDDPRRAYQREAERSMTDLASGAPAPGAVADRRPGPWPGVGIEDRELPKVAEPESEYGKD